ncbi:MAG: sigma-70 family RNA polymerase sigma factor [Lachnospiraceae bacterium]|nr:sigma-70 family RNA polymerase sigma factor [Robinsoniella sp.]MDY3765373.1 sigma-70 family RNA polymerase sigma factor [Lachnospiraceae bacterium]
MHFFFEKKDKINKTLANKTLIEKTILEKYNQYYRLAYSYVHNEEDACDIVQNGAYKALRSSHTLQNPEYVETWVYRIMLNECFGYLQQPKFLSYEAVQDETGIDLGYKEDHYANVDLQRALDGLPDKDKAIVILKYFEDKKLEEIAEILEENVNTVKSRLYRSMKKLRGSLSEEVKGNDDNLGNG